MILLFLIRKRYMWGKTMLDNRVYSLLKVYECGSFVAAARELNVTQPAVSQHVKALEEELNVTIFDRGKGKLVLTKEGDEIVKCAQKLAGIYASLRQSLSDGAAQVTRLTIGVTQYFARLRGYSQGWTGPS